MPGLTERQQRAMENNRRAYQANQRTDEYLFNEESSLNDHDLWEQIMRWRGLSYTLDRLKPSLHEGARVELDDGERVERGTLTYGKSTIGLPTWYLHLEDTDHALAYTHGNFRVKVKFI